MKKPILFDFLMIMLATVILSACQTEPPLPTATSTSDPTSIATLIPTTISPTMTPRITYRATPTPGPTYTKRPTRTPTITDTPDPNRYNSPNLDYSLVAPAGWRQGDLDLDDPALIGPKIGDYEINLIFYQEKAVMGSGFYSAVLQDDLERNLTGFVSLSEDYLSTLEGQDYFRWEMTHTLKGVKMRRVFYFFDSSSSSGEWVLVITYTRPSSAGSEYDQEVEKAISTVRYSR